MANCCGNNAPGSGNPQGAPAPAGFNMSDVPDNMVLMEYLGGNLGTTLWGGPGGTPSGRYYTFGAGENDRIKHVDQRDVAWFVDRRENKQTLFAVYQEPGPSDMELLATAIATDLLKEAQGAPESDAARDFANAGNPAQDGPELEGEAPPVEEPKAPSEAPPVEEPKAPSEAPTAAPDATPVGDELAGIVEIEPEDMTIIDLPDATPAPTKKRRH